MDVMRRILLIISLFMLAAAWTGCSSTSRLAAVDFGEAFTSLPFNGGPPGGQWEPEIETAHTDLK